ncbi:unnamed protein product [Ectocarpus fasciculatus]
MERTLQRTHTTHFPAVLSMRHPEVGQRVGLFLVDQHRSPSDFPSVVTLVGLQGALALNTELGGIALQSERKPTAPEKPNAYCACACEEDTRQGECDPTISDLNRNYHSANTHTNSW